MSHGAFIVTEDITSPNPASDPEAGEMASNTHQFVMFIVGDEVFAVDMTPVQEIIRVPSVVRVPLSPLALNGLASLRGRILPIISLRRIFGLGERTHDDSTRAIVINIGQPMGFVVDRVASVINIETDHIEGSDGIRSAIDSELLTGILKDVGGYPMVMVLEFGKLIAREFASIVTLARHNGPSLTTTEPVSGASDDIDNDERQLVSFSVANQEYAIDIGSVNEIVQIPENIVRIPNSPRHVLGLMTLRACLLPLVSLRCLFGLPARELDEKSRIVVISTGAMAVGIVTDSVSEVLRVPRDAVDTLPDLLARDDDLADIDQICRLDGGKRLVSILSAKHLFRHSIIEDAMRSAERMNEDRVDDQDEETLDNEDEEQVVVFHLASCEFGVPIDSVQEIVRVPDELTHVPKAPDFIEGVINLRGSVLPVIDQRKRLDLPPIERNDRQRIMVFMLRGVRTGLIVDAVTEVLKIPRQAIEESPRLSSEQVRLLGRVANLEKQKRMIQLIDPTHLIDDGDTVSLTSILAS